MIRALTLAACLAVLAPAAAKASPASIERGRWLAQTNCASCHAVGQERSSPDKTAPPFRNLSKAYPTRNLDEIFADGVLKNHSAMPQFGPGTEDISDLLDYLQSIQVKSGG